MKNINKFALTIRPGNIAPVTPRAFIHMMGLNCSNWPELKADPDIAGTGVNHAQF